MRTQGHIRTWLGWIGGMILIGCGPALFAGDLNTFAAPGGLDRQIYEVLKDVHNAGADLHNSGDATGCYRVYQGGLLALKPLLSHRPDCQQLIERGFKTAELQPTMAQRSFTLHKTFEELRAQLKPNDPVLHEPKPLPTADPPSAAPPKTNSTPVQDKPPSVSPPVPAASSASTTGTPTPAPASPPVNANPNPAPPALPLPPNSPPAPSFDPPAPASGTPAPVTTTPTNPLPPPVQGFEIQPPVSAPQSEKQNGTAAPSSAPSSGKEPPPNAETLWKQLGGQTKIEKMVDEFVTAAIADPKANWSRGDKIKFDEPTVKTLKRKLVGYVSALTDGTVPYTGPIPRDFQKEMNFSAVEFAAMLNVLNGVLEKNQIPPAAGQELIKKVTSGWEEASRTNNSP